MRYIISYIEREKELLKTCLEKSDNSTTKGDAIVMLDAVEYLEEKIKKGQRIGMFDKVLLRGLGIKNKIIEKILG